MKWSNEQLEAIKSCYTNELVNAGAGSGKTAVLSEHVIHLIKNNNFELKDFLIVTFTNDAANEMKQRIRDNLLKEESLSYMVDQIETAHIQTFDAFNLFIVKKYAHVLGLNNNLSILDQSILDVETIRIIDELFEQKYLQKDEEFASLISSLCVKNDKDVKILINNIIKVSDRAIDSEQYLNTFVTHFYSDEFIDNLISERFEEMKDTLNRALYLCDEIDDSDIGDNYKSTITSLLANKDYDSLLLATSSVKLAKKSSKSICENEELRKYVMDLLNSFKNKKFNFGFTNDIKNFYKSAQKYVEIIIKLTKEVLNRINEFKHKYNMYTFNDIAKFAIEAMKNDDVRNDVRNTFRYIMVDEYQDTNGIQETMIELLEDNNVFMVGDVKQSIYRFRNADCTIFENKYQKYKKNINGHAIDMTENYRSRKEFMADLNYMFSLLMDKKHNPISYIDNHISKPGNKAYDDKVDDKLTYGISALTYSSDDIVVNQAYHEAKIIAEDILRKLEKGVEVFDKKLGTLRKATFNDFAIIIDRESSFDTFKYVFGKYKIPLYAQRKEKLLFTEMSLVIKNLFVLLECVKNNIFDNKFKHAFVSIARSFLVQYEDSFIYKIIKDDSYLFDDIVMKIRKIIEQNPFNNLKETLEQFYETFQFNKHMVELGDINENEYYFDYFISIADTFDKMNRNCLDYINFFNELDKNKLEIETASVKDSDNAVLLINIHKSKGREFPICYFPRLNVKFMVSSDKCPLRIDAKYGMTLTSLYKDDIIPLNNYLAKCQNRKENFYEKLRIFYVALTRARECAILVYDIDEVKKGYDITKANTFLNILSYTNLEDIKNNFVSSFNDKEYSGEQSNENKIFVLKTKQDIEYSEIEIKRASKIIKDDSNEKALKYGEKLHYLLELVDFSTKNVDFIKDEKDKKIIKKVINNPLFDIGGDDKILHEYSYHDDHNGVDGVIDCLLIKDNEIDIIDFKLKNIDDELYKNQLLTYKKYISQIISGKIIKMYLLSIIDNSIKEVKDD